MQLDGSEPGIGAITVAGSVDVVNGTTAYPAGTIGNTGNLTIDSLGNGTALWLASQSVTLTGGGTLTMTDNANNSFFGNALYFPLVNSNNLITGAGQLGGNRSSFTNIGASLTTIAAGGSLAIGAAGALSVAAKTLSDAGQVSLARATLTATSLAVVQTGTLSGFGTEKGSVAETGSVIAAGGTLDVTGSLAAAGTLSTDNKAAALIGAKLTVQSVAFAAAQALAIGSVSGLRAVPDPPVVTAGAGLHEVAAGLPRAAGAMSAFATPERFPTMSGTEPHIAGDAWVGLIPLGHMLAG